MKQLICFGDSMVFGYLAPRSDCWVARINTASDYQAIGRGINGDTTAGMLRRFPEQVLDAAPDALILLAGTNDFLTGLPIKDTQNNLMYMMRRAEAENIRVFLATLTPYCTEAFGIDTRFYGDFQRASLLRAELNAWIRNKPECLDLAASFEALPPSDLHALYIDGVHLNSSGHALAAKTIAEYLQQ